MKTLNQFMNAVQVWWSSDRVDDRLDDSARTRIVVLRQKSQDVWKQFEGDIEEEMADEESPSSFSYNEAQRQLAPFERRIRDIEAEPWLRVARDYDLDPVPPLFGDDCEPIDGNFAKLKRMVRAAERREGKETLEARATKAGLWVGLVSLLFTAGSVYAQFVFQSDFANITVDPISFVDGRMTTGGLIGNSGTRPIAIRSVTVFAMGPGNRVGLGPAAEKEGNSTFPIILEPGELKEFSIAQRFDIRRALDNEAIGRRVAPGLKAIDFRCSVFFTDVSGNQNWSEFPLYTQFANAEGAANRPGTGPQVIPLESRIGQRQVLIRRWRLLGPLSPEGTSVSVFEDLQR